MVLEKNIEAKVVRWATAQGWEVIKLNGMGNRSRPDRLFVMPYGRCAFIEFKRPGGVLTRLQEQTLKRLANLGHDVAMFDDAAKAIAWLEEMSE